MLLYLITQIKFCLSFFLQIVNLITRAHTKNPQNLLLHQSNFSTEFERWAKYYLIGAMLDGIESTNEDK